MDKQLIEQYNLQFSNKNSDEILDFFLKEYKNKIAFSTSMGAEDQVITKIMAGLDPEACIFTLDTGRTFPEIYELIEKTNARYKINIKIMFPDRQEVEKMVNEKGINLFYKSIENRKLCCNIRKIKPLQRALKGYQVWVTGLRQEQSVTRTDMQLCEWDDKSRIMKLNPLINWTEEDVWNYIKEKNIPYNPLHDQGFPSIGCQPCTRAIEKGEDVRAGRWWWENPESKECGLHK